MPRTTINIDAPVLRDLKRLQRREGKALGRLISDLLAQALGSQGRGEPGPTSFEWASHPMRARVDVTDKDAVDAALERSDNLASAVRMKS